MQEEDLALAVEFAVDSFFDGEFIEACNICNDCSAVELLARHRSTPLLTSAVTGEGLDKLVCEIVARMKGRTVEVTVLIPHTAGKLLSDVDRLADDMVDMMLGGVAGRTEPERR